MVEISLISMIFQTKPLRSSLLRTPKAPQWKKSGKFSIWTWDGVSTDSLYRHPEIEFKKGQKPEGVAAVTLPKDKKAYLLVDDSGGYFVLPSTALGF